jgi:streptogramin lyase
VKAFAILTVVAALALAAPAHAGVVAELEFGSSFGDLVVAPDGGAWVFIDRPEFDAVGRAEPDGRFRTAATIESGLVGELGPDGTAWYSTGGLDFLRVDAGDTLSAVGTRVVQDEHYTFYAAGPDGTMWSPTPEQDGIWHIAPDGSTTKTAGVLPAPCPDGSLYLDLTRGSDDAMWLADTNCRRLVRIGPGGSSTVGLGFEPASLAADAAGGVWVTGFLDADRVAHVGASGDVATFAVPKQEVVHGIAVAPDGSAWVAVGACRVLRVTPAGEVTREPVPVPALDVQFDPAGGLWAMSRKRLVHLGAGEGVGACDDRPPAVRVTRGPISLDRLRRTGLTVRLREPAELTVDVSFRDSRAPRLTPGDDVDRIVRGAHGEALRYRVPAKVLRRLARELAAGRAPFVRLSIVAADADGNVRTVISRVRVRR